MGFLSRLLGRPQRTRVKTTVDHPLVIVNPILGFLNLQGKAGATLAEIDRTALAPLFAANRVSTRDPPLCNVLFLYCSFDTGGSLIGSRATIRDLIIAAQAHVAVVACDTDQKVMARAAKRTVARRGEWPANIVWTLARNGDKFERFFHRIFDAMFYGQTMPVAYVRICPQVPGHHPGIEDLPATVMVMEAGHIVFRQGP
jgi:hypothetical protein